MSKRNVYAAAAGILFGLLAVFVLYKALPSGEKSVALSGEPVDAVVLIPGYGGDTSNFSELEKGLQAEGVVYEYAQVGDVHGDLEQYGKTVAGQVEELRSEGKTVGLIGFSAGGLIARSAVGQGAEPARVATVASPHKGTETASLASAFVPGSCDTACTQMKPKSDFLGALDGGTPEWLSVYSDGDEVIRPYTNSVLDGAENFDVTECGVSVTHSSLIRNGLVVGQVVNFLTLPEPAVSC